MTIISWVRDEGSFFRPDRPLFCPLFQEVIPILVYSDGRQVQPEQFQALSLFLDIPANEREKLTASLYKDYLEVTEAVGEGPEIAEADRVWEHVKWTSILVPLQGDSGSRFVFVIGDPAWEEEHGVEMLFRDERLVRLDRASGAFLSNCFWKWS